MLRILWRYINAQFILFESNFSDSASDWVLENYFVRILIASLPNRIIFRYLGQLINVVRTWEDESFARSARRERVRENRARAGARARSRCNEMKMKYRKRSWLRKICTCCSKKANTPRKHESGGGDSRFSATAEVIVAFMLHKIEVEERARIIHVRVIARTATSTKSTERVSFFLKLFSFSTRSRNE